MVRKADATKDTISLRMDAEILEGVDRAAKAEERSRSQIFARAAADYLAYGELREAVEFQAKSEGLARSEIIAKALAQYLEMHGRPLSSKPAAKTGNK